MGKNRRREKNRARLCIVYLFIYLYLHLSLYILQWMNGNIYREVFPTFLAKKSYDWWITRRRMEIYTKISKRKDLKWSRQKQGKIRTTHGLCEFGRCCANFTQPGGVVRISRCCVNFAQAWSICLPKAIYSSFQLQIIHGLKRWILDFLSFEMVYSI